MRLESCFPPFLRKGGVVVRVRGMGGRWRWYGKKVVVDGRGRGRVWVSLVLRTVGSWARIAAWSYS